MAFQEMRSALIASVAACACMMVATPAEAQTRSFSVPAQSATTGIPEFARQADVQILVSESAARGRTTRAVNGRMPVRQALERLLVGTGLSISSSDGRTFTLSVDAAGSGEGEAGGAAADNESAEQGEITVTGTRIRGAAPAAPVITVTAEQARRAGQTDLGEVLRSIPQNFNGGSNPGIGYGGAENYGSEPSSGQSSPNLRGLGQSATLTLLNGRRMPYTLTGQGVDISAIPLAAVERVEIVPDGASALYGSDAVAGVINVLLKRDYEGLTAIGRSGLSTDGGNETVGLEMVSGTQWSSGGVLVAGGYSHASMIRARDRDYVTNFDGSGTLYPRLGTWQGLASAHQQLAPGINVRVDALYTDRSSRRETAYTTNGDYRTSGLLFDDGSRAAFVSPTVELHIPGGWAGDLNYSYGRDVSRAELTYYTNGNVDNNVRTRLANSSTVVDFNGEGPLFGLPAGSARLAFGGGYRHVHFERRDLSPVANTDSGFGASRESWYGYGELFVPIVAPFQDVRGIHRLSLTGAFRHEDYRDFGGVTTPKLSIIYAPSPDLRFSATWGRSFKTPTPQQQNRPPTVLVAPASLFGGTGYPATATALVIAGGNPGLGPERSTNWSVTLTATPRVIPGLTVDLSYFNIDYRDRITAPISSLLTALSNPLYASFRTFAPSAAEVADAAALALAPSYFVNLSGGPFDPSQVVALVDGRATNVSRERIEGVDVAATYSAATGGGGELTTSLNLAYLASRRTVIPGTPELALAGTVFNPPHWRARGGVGWSNARWTLSSFVNYVGELDDVRTSTVYELAGQATFDLTAGYRFDEGALEGFSVQLSALNLFNAKPRAIVTSSAAGVPYESTNYSPVGRYLSLTVTRRF